MQRKNQTVLSKFVVVFLEIFLFGLIRISDAWIIPSSYSITNHHYKPKTAMATTATTARFQKILKNSPTLSIPLFLSSDVNDRKDDDDDIEKPKIEWGVSYIGGDPCGSKYNNDPFDVQVTKPGMPDDMKARIQALVDKKVAQEKLEQQQQKDEK